ncbi:hypothetical protein [Mesorhizobium shangrilense]|uniref:Uncharacterized protein n=1 Tax=Mesorhizobium shangrilense TaxID=460060 RepID=A0ABV2DMI6_9HYPH
MSGLRRIRVLSEKGHRLWNPAGNASEGVTTLRDLIRIHDGPSFLISRPKPAGEISALIADHLRAEAMTSAVANPIVSVKSVAGMLSGDEHRIVGRMRSGVGNP